MLASYAGHIDVVNRLLKLGADIVMHSSTKYLGGHSDVIQGALMMNDAAIRERLYFIQKSCGAVPGPFDCFLVLRGIKTLPVRMKAHCENAMQLAQWLQQHPAIEQVYYPGLCSHPQHALAMQQQSGKGGAVLSFDVRGDTPEAGRKNAFHLIDSTRLMSVTANLGDVKTIITQPASTSHGRLTEAQRMEAGIRQHLVRVAVGLENIEDLKADLSRGLDTL